MMKITTVTLPRGISTGTTGTQTRKRPDKRTDEQVNRSGLQSTTVGAGWSAHVLSCTPNNAQQAASSSSTTATLHRPHGSGHTANQTSKHNIRPNLAQN
eukprot:COSAG02_NODE_1235_length_13736_cov_12.313265_4_plen_99_part_00